MHRVAWQPCPSEPSPNILLLIVDSTNKKSQFVSYFFSWALNVWLSSIISLELLSWAEQCMWVNVGDWTKINCTWICSAYRTVQMHQVSTAVCYLNRFSQNFSKVTSSNYPFFVSIQVCLRIPRTFQTCGGWHVESCVIFHSVPVFNTLHCP